MQCNASIQFFTTIVGNTEEQKSGEIVYDEKAREVVITVLGFLRDQGELLFFPDNPDLCEDVITRPMDFVRSLRTVISHRTGDIFKKAQFQEKKLELLQKGLLCYEDFRTIYNSGEKQAFQEKQVWDFMIQLNLACSLNESENNRQIMVPSLITDKMEEKVKSRGEKLQRHEACISVQYNFDKNAGHLC